MPAFRTSDRVARARVVAGCNLFLALSASALLGLAAFGGGVASVFAVLVAIGSARTGGAGGSSAGVRIGGAGEPSQRGHMVLHYLAGRCRPLLARPSVVPSSPPPGAPFGSTELFPSCSLSRPLWGPWQGGSLPCNQVLPVRSRRWKPDRVGCLKDAGSCAGTRSSWRHCPSISSRYWRAGPWHFCPYSPEISSESGLPASGCFVAHPPLTRR